MTANSTTPKTQQIKSIVRLSLREQVRKSLIDRILTGDLPEGTRINESHLAKALGVSQTPVREALLGLEGQGFLATLPAKGFFIKEFSEREAREIYPVLADLEAMALEAAGIPGPELLDEMDRINEGFADAAGSPERSIEVDERFHTRLLSGCPNRYLLQLANQTRLTAYRYEYAYMGESDLISNSSNHHLMIVSHLRRGRLKDAIKRLRKAWLASVADVVRWLEQRGRSHPDRKGR